MNVAANENRTKIYRIRRKADGLFLIHLGHGMAHGSEHGTWGPNGVFFWKPETIRKHLLELCQFRVYCSEGGTVFDLRKRHRGRRQKARDALNPFWVIYGLDQPVHLVSTVYEWLDLYEVVVSDITVHSEDAQEAKDFACFNPVEEEAAA